MKTSNEWYQEGWASASKSVPCPYTRDTLQYRSWWAGRFGAQEDPAWQQEQGTEQYLASRG